MSKKEYACKVCYIFIGLSISFVAVLVVWILQYENTKETKNEKSMPSTGKKENYNNTCPIIDLLGDGYCDDQALTEACAYDYNDCCSMEKDRSLCENCSCILDESEINELIKDQCSDGELAIYFGEGVCDLHYNSPKFFFDVGDCCLDDVICADTTFRIVPCPEKSCIRSNNYCITEELGDGICQDHNNGIFCDFDMGDCCLTNKNHEFCCHCVCMHMPEGGFHVFG